MSPKNQESSKVTWGEEPEFFGPRHFFRESLILRNLKKRMGVPSMILDAGSGNGSLSIRIGRAGYKVVGVDASDEFVSYAAERSEELHLNGAARFQKMDLLHTEFDDETYDAVVSGEVLEHLERDGDAVQEFYRLLRPGGYSVVTVPAHPHMWDRDDEWAGHVRRYTMEALKQLFAGKGFAVEQCHYWGFPLVRVFHQAVYLPLVRRKIMQQEANITRQKSFPFRMLENQYLHRMVATLFHFDNLFNVFPWGIGLLLVARKSS